MIRIYYVEGLDLDEDTKTYWYLFLLLELLSPLGVHDMAPKASCNLVVVAMEENIKNRKPLSGYTSF